jgi:hypothetical protein
MNDHERKIATQNAIRQARAAWIDLLFTAIHDPTQRGQLADRGLAAMLTAGWQPPTQPATRKIRS